MKRIGNLFEKVISMDNLKLAHKNAKRGKAWYKEVKMVDANPEYYLSLLQDMLINKTYQTSEYETFTKTDGVKQRTIYKLPYFPDRICQWALIQVLEPYFLRTMTADTYSAIPGRGIHSCLAKVKQAVYFDPIETNYCLKFDIKKYYPSINHKLLMGKYKRMFKDKEVIWLLDEIINSTEGDTGIPIGNYLSQYSGNLFLSDFDHWLKEVKGVKYYYRYMDDIVIFGKDKKALHALRLEIKDYLANLSLIIKDNWQIFPTAVRGVDFLGYRVFRGFTLLRKSIAKNYKRLMRWIINKVISQADIFAIASYAGWLKHCNSYRLSQIYSRPLLNLVGG